MDNIAAEFVDIFTVDIIITSKWTLFPVWHFYCGHFFSAWTYLQWTFFPFVDIFYRWRFYHEQALSNLIF